MSLSKGRKNEIKRLSAEYKNVKFVNYILFKCWRVIKPVEEVA